MNMLVYVNADGSYTIYLDGARQLPTKVWLKVLDIARLHGENKFTVVDYHN